VTQEDVQALAASIAPIVAAEVADLVVRHIAERAEREFLDASELARVLGVDRQWVYEHQERLGAIRLGNGRRPRLRFELTRAVKAFDEPPATGPTRLANGDRRSPLPRPRRSRGRRR
jgi:hypothetical protein